MTESSDRVRLGIGELVRRALVVNAPLLAFLLYYRVMVWENRYVTYRLPLLGEMPNGVISDYTLVALAVGLWLLARQARLQRLLVGFALAPLGTLVVLFRLVDYYYFTSTKVRLNAYVLYSNWSMMEEGMGIVRASPLMLVAALLVGAHYLAVALSARYRDWLAAVAARAGRTGRPAWLAAGAVAALVMLINAHAVMVHPRRYSTLKALSGEYEFVDALPGFLREGVTETSTPAPRPARLYLPVAGRSLAAGRDTMLSAARAVSRRPDVFIVTVESFNALYTLPAHELNPALTDDVMPFFRSLDTAGFSFSRVYTSSAYTFDGITSVLCSQYTMSERPWGRGCLPEVLRGDGYQAFSFIAIKQLRPYRFDNFSAMGFDRDKVYDAPAMRRGKKNVYFAFLADKELLESAAFIADSVAHARPRRPLFVHASTNQMHVPGYFQVTDCKPYPFPPGFAVDAQTRNMLDSARCTDRDLASFIGRLRASGLYDDALIIITADHAFNLSFWAHRESELARIPMFVKLPRSMQSMRLDTAQLAAQIDIAPTILDVVGLGSTRPMYGRSLLRADTVTARRSVAGVSSSRLLSLATPSGVVFHQHGQADVADPAVRDEMESLFSTVLYFDQHPDEFERAARDTPRAGRWPPTPSVAVAPGARPR